jgi:hypothetical protein
MTPRRFDSLGDALEWLSGEPVVRARPGIIAGASAMVNRLLILGRDRWGIPIVRNPAELGGAEMLLFGQPVLRDETVPAGRVEWRMPGWTVAIEASPEVGWDVWEPR